MKVHGALLIPTFALLSAFAQTSRAGELGGVLKNNAGVKKFGSEKGIGAFDDFTGALSDLPYSSAVHFNIGNSFLRNKEYEKAISEYKSAINEAKTNSRIDRASKFRALFNAAIAQTELKKNDEALDLYQAALDVDPSSQETKTNMEILARSQQGGGEGDKQDKNDKDKDDKKDKKEDQDGKDKKQPKDPQKFDNPKPSPKPFKSEELTQQDVKRILEELKRQEEQIRTRMENEQTKTAPPGKDW